MSTLSSYMIENPYGDMDECAQFIIPHHQEQYTLTGVAPAGHKYTFSFWGKTANNRRGDVYLWIGGPSVQLYSHKWTKFSTTFVSESDDLVLHFASAGTYYIYNPKLELGSIATDWSPAPEDVTEDIDQAVGEKADEINRIIIDQRAELITTYEGILMSALKSYVEETEFSTYRETFESELKLLADSMTLRFTQTESSMSALGSELNDKFNTITKYFTFNIDGLTIGQIDNPNQVVIDNDEISILVNGIAVQRFDASGKAIIPDLNVNRTLNLLGLLIDKDEYGNINCEYVG